MTATKCSQPGCGHLVASHTPFCGCTEVRKTGVCGCSRTYPTTEETQ